MNIQKLLKQAQQMQGKVQQELSETSVEAAVGGGIVTVRMNGHKQLLEVKIDPEAMDPADPSMLEDLFLAAVNEANRKVDEVLKEKIGSMAPGIPGLF
jgi:nucleoid-associated protein EbfC